MYQRRFLPSLDDHNYQDGAYATKWAGWYSPPWSFDYSTHKTIKHFERVDDIEDRVGCYAILYKAGQGSHYVAYVGYSRILHSEIKKKYGHFDPYPLAQFPFACIYIPNAAIATRYEDALLRYYCPPWNTKFYRQGLVKKRKPGLHG